MFQTSLKLVISLIVFATPVLTKAQVDYKISNECYPEDITQKISLINKDGLVLKEWSNTFSRIYKPLKGDSLFVAEVSYHNIYVCLGKDLEIRFVFPLDCKALVFDNGYSIISRGIGKEGAVNREGEVIFSPEHEYVYTRDDGSVVAGDRFRLTGVYYRFTIKDQGGNLIGSFLFCLPRYMDHFFEVPIHASTLNCLVNEDDIYFNETTDETDRLLVKALQNHLKGNYQDAIRDYESVLQRKDHTLLQESALYNYLACRHMIGLDNDYEQYKEAEYIKYAAIDGLFGKRTQDILLEEELNNLYKNGLGVIFSDIKPSLYNDSLKYAFIPFSCIGNEVLYSSMSGEHKLEIEDTHYYVFKDRFYFDGYQSNETLAENILKEKNDFVLANSPEEWQNSQNVLFVSIALPNSIRIKVIGNSQLKIPQSQARYITDIVAFMQSSCQKHQLKRLALVFPLPPK